MLVQRLLCGLCRGTGGAEERARAAPAAGGSGAASVRVERLNLSASTRGVVPPLRVLTWNVLADGLAQEGNFAKCAQEVLEWDVRGPEVVRLLLQAEADVLCLQEVNTFAPRGDLVGLETELSRAGYEGVFVAKRSSPCVRLGFPPDGVCIFYRKARLQPAGDLFSAAYLTEAGEEQSQVRIVLPLRDMVTKHTVCFATTHLKAKSGEEGVRTLQARQLLEDVERIGGEDGRIIVVGDFNAVPSEEAVSLFVGSGFASAWGLPPEEGHFTTWKFRSNEGKVTEKRATIDYQFYRGSLRPVARFAQMGVEEIGPDGLPCRAYPSDHLAVVVDYEVLTSL